MPEWDIYYRRNLPHIHPAGYPLFITFSLVDSLPREILADLRTQREQELQTAQNAPADERYKIQKKFFGRYDAWLDRCEYGFRWLADPALAQIVANQIHLADGQQYQLLALCIMPNHVHLLITPLALEPLLHHGQAAPYPVTDALRLLKGRTAHSCNQVLARSGAFWQHESYDHYVRDEDELARIIAYILNNPVKAGLVSGWKDWPYTYVNPELGEW